MTNQRVAIVTGASRGIGRGITLALAAAGFDVVVNYASNATAADAVRAEVQCLGRRALVVRGDVSVPADRRAIVDETLKAFGRIDVLVNNAGITSIGRADLLDATEEAFDRLIGVNLKGPYFLTQLVAREMVARRDAAPAPAIVNITSISAYAVSTNRGDYCIAKAGLAMMTQLYAARLAEHGINVYEIRPGVIETDMTGPVKEKYDRLIHEEGLTPIRRWGTPDDVARAVVAVATGAFPFSTGEVINVDGGYHVRRI